MPPLWHTAHCAPGQKSYRQLKSDFFQPAASGAAWLTAFRSLYFIGDYKFQTWQRKPTYWSIQYRRVTPASFTKHSCPQIFKTSHFSFLNLKYVKPCYRNQQSGPLAILGHQYKILFADPVWPKNCSRAHCYQGVRSWSGIKNISETGTNIIYYFHYQKNIGLVIIGFTLDLFSNPWRQSWWYEW